MDFNVAAAAAAGGRIDGGTQVAKISRPAASDGGSYNASDGGSYTVMAAAAR